MPGDYSAVPEASAKEETHEAALENQPQYLEPTQESGRALMMRRLEGKVVMLNLLRFRAVADYSATPAWRRRRRSAAPPPSTGISSTPCPFCAKAAASCVSSAKEAPSDRSARRAVGPGDAGRAAKRRVLSGLRRNEAYLPGIGHRTAAIEDSRLLPLEPLAPGASPAAACLPGGLPAFLGW